MKSDDAVEYTVRKRQAFSGATHQYNALTCMHEPLLGNHQPAESNVRPDQGIESPLRSKKKAAGATSDLETGLARPAAGQMTVDRFKAGIASILSAQRIVNVTLHRGARHVRGYLPIEANEIFERNPRGLFREDARFLIFIL